MATGRIIDKCISMSEKLSEVSAEAQLIYTWMIPHADDLGLLQGSAKTIKYQVVPMLEIALDDVEGNLQWMTEKGLLSLVEYEGKSYYHISGFTNFQKLRRDRQPQTILHLELKSDPKDSWKLCEEVLEKCINKSRSIIAESVTREALSMTVSGSQMTDSGRQMTAEVKRSEGKRSNTGTAQKPHPASSMSDVLSEKKQSLQKLQENGANTGIHTEWQDKALRYAKELGIELKSIDKGRWFKAFKQASEGRKPGNLEQAYRYLKDHPHDLASAGKLKMFFKIYENGLKGSND